MWEEDRIRDVLKEEGIDYKTSRGKKAQGLFEGTAFVRTSRFHPVEMGEGERLEKKERDQAKNSHPSLNAVLRATGEPCLRSLLKQQQRQSVHLALSSVR